MKPDEVNFCPRCGAAVSQAVRFGRLRTVCPACDWVHFSDPKVAAAAVVLRDGEVLLVRRGINPRRGFWTLPAGFVDAGEDPARAAERECLEETGLRIGVTSLLDVLFGQEHENGAHIIIFYRAEIVDGQLRARDDVDKAGFFHPRDLPPLAFQTSDQVLQLLQKE